MDDDRVHVFVKRCCGSEVQEEYVLLKNVVPEKGRWIVPVYPTKVAKQEDRWPASDDRNTPVLKDSYFKSNKFHPHNTRYKPY